jgi:diguanylate cyclase (GGDEF)-like protein/PAS domain S-box-containing protein
VRLVVPVASPDSLRGQWQSLIRARRRVSWLPVAIAACGASSFGWIFIVEVPPDVRSIVTSLALIPIGLITAFLGWRVSQHAGLESRLRAGWQLVTLSAVLMLSGEIWWIAVEDLQRGAAAPVFTNAPYLAFYLVVATAVFPLTARVGSRRDRLKFGLDATTVFVGGGMLVWHAAIVPVLAARAGSAVALGVRLSYPAADLVLLVAIAVLLLRCPGGARRRPMLLLGASFLARLAGDVIRVHAAPTGALAAGGPQDLFYLAQYLLLAVALDAEQRRLEAPAAESDSGPRPVGALPHVALLCGYVLVLVAAWSGSDRHTFQLTIGAIVLTLLTALRQMISARESLLLQRERVVLSGEARFRSLVQHASDVLSIVDVGGTVSFASPSAESILGHTPASLVGTSILALLHPDDAIDASRRFEEVLDTGRAATGRWRVQRKDGTWIQTDNICTNLIDDENVRGLVLNTRDISERCALEAQLVHQAFHDPLTGLANRALFLDRVRHAMARRLHGSDGLGVLFIDLDQFKTVNDSLGHQVGDLLLRGVSERLSSGLRSFDTIARLGGDEFAVLIDDAEGDDGVMVIADRVGQALRDPFILEGREVVTLASIGVALVTAEQSAEDLLRNADLAMYLAKNRGGGQTALFEPEMHAAMLNRLELQADLRRALDRGEFSLVYQPVHALETQALVGVEALLRWAHPTRGSVPPNVFIPIAEQTGMIVPIGKWVIDQACRDAHEWRVHLADRAPQSLAVNISGRQIPDPALFDDIQAALTRSELPANALVLELTESILLTHTDQTLSVMHRLKDIGVGLALDDFGTGYSSLSYLQRLPIDVLKIDRAFVERLETDASASALTRAIVGLGKTLSLQTVAEGVENRTQAELLRHLGCDHGQGFLYGMPMPARELERYARRVRKFVAA